MSCKPLIIVIITRCLCCSVRSRKRRWQWPKPRISWRATHTLPMTLTPRPCLHTPWLCCAALTPRWPCAASTTWPSHKVLPHSSLRAAHTQHERVTGGSFTQSSVTWTTDVLPGDRQRPDVEWKCSVTTRLMQHERNCGNVVKCRSLRLISLIRSLQQHKTITDLQFKPPALRLLAVWTSSQAQDTGQKQLWEELWQHSTSSIHSSLSPSVSYLTVGFLWPFPSLPLDWKFLQVLADLTEFRGAQKCSYLITIIVFPKYNEGTGLGCIVAERFRQLGYWYNESYDTGCRPCALSVFISRCLSA